LGFYSIDIELSETLVVVRKSGYFSQFMDINDIEENETLWYNVSLNPGAPLENSIVCGYITDNLTDDPIDGADVFYINSIDLMPNDWNYTSTNPSGFYSINVPTADEAYFYSDADGYYNNASMKHNISENETLWINSSLYPIPPENSIICGYITNELTETPIENARFHFHWRDNQGHSYSNDTYTNHSGFYSVNVSEGEISDINVYADGYYSKYEGSYDIDEYETLWVNISLYPKPPKNSVLRGYITDETTDAPIENASVRLYWNDNHGHHDLNYTSTDSYGFYSMNVAAGEINISVEDDEYLGEHTESYDISEYESLEINFSMKFIINENSIVKGYITDVETDNPIINAYVSLHWYDDRGHSYWNYVFTDSSGFYEMDVASGEISIHAHAYGYLSEYTEDYEIDEYDTLWINVPMQREVIKINIVKPQKALYIANYRIMPLLLKTVIYGDIDIEIDASDSTSFVEFRVDGTIRANDDSEPYTWTWNTRSPLKHRHIIEVVAYGRFGSSATDEITVWRFF